MSCGMSIDGEEENNIPTIENTIYENISEEEQENDDDIAMICEQCFSMLKGL